MVIVRKILYSIVIFSLLGIMMSCREKEHLDKAGGSPGEALACLETLDFEKSDERQQTMRHLHLLISRNDKLVQEKWMIILAFALFVSLTMLFYKLSRKKHIMDCCLLDMRIKTLESRQKQIEKEQDYLREIILRDLELSKRIALFKNRQTEKSRSFLKSSTDCFLSAGITPLNSNGIRFIRI